MRLFLQKNDTSKNEKIPYFTLKLVPEEGDKDQEWQEIGAFWKAKSGFGYSGVVNEGVVIDASKVVPFKKKQEVESEKGEKDFEDVGQKKED